MTVIRKYTDSSLNDAIVDFFRTYKDPKGNYKYADMIHDMTHEPYKITLDQADFTEELREIMVNEPKHRIHNAIYRAIGEKFQGQHGKTQMNEYQEKDLFCYEILNNADFAGGLFKRPEPPTEEKLIEEISKIINNLPKEDQNFDRVYEPLISTSDIGYMGEYREGHNNYKELVKLIEWHLNEDKKTDVKVTLAADLLASKYDFAHIDGMPLKEQHNCFVYRRNMWDRNTSNFALRKLTKYKGMDQFAVNTHITDQTSYKLSVHDDTLEVFINDQYRKTRSRMIIDGSGHFFDLQAGVIRKIDPSQHFFEATDVKYDLIDDTREPTQFIEMLQTRYGKNWEIVRDQLAGVFLHADDLGSRAKALILVGPTGTYKSTIMDKFADLLDDDTVTSMSITQMGKDDFAKSMIANNLLNHSQEETARSMQQGHATFKDILTKSKDKARGMWSKRMVPVYRYPRWILATNKLPAIAQDDEDASIFNRLLYIKSLPISDKDKIWRDYFNTEREKQEILMYLLKRSYQIYKEPTQMKTQSLEETGLIYIELTTGSLSAFLGMTEESRLTSNYKHTGSNTGGLLHLDVWQEFNKHAGSTMSKAKFNGLLEDLKLTKARINCRMIEDGYGNYEKDNEGTRLTLIMGIERKNSSKPPAKSTLD